MDTSSISPKDFLTQVEQQYGKKVSLLLKAVLAVLGVVIGAAFISLVAPIVIGGFAAATTILAKGLVLAALIGLTLLIVRTATNPRMIAMFRDQYNGWIQKAIKRGVTINPIERMEAYADEYLGNKLKLVHGIQDTIRGAKNSNDARIEEKAQELQELVTQAAALKKRSLVDDRTNTWKNDQRGQEDHVTFRELSDTIEMLKQSLEKFAKMAKRYEFFLALLEKFERAFSLSVTKIRNTVKIVSDELQASQEMSRAVGAMGDLMGDPDEQTKIFNMTLEYASQQVASNVARVENFFDRTRTIIRSGELQNDMAEERLMQELNVMNTETDQAISNMEKPAPATIAEMQSSVDNASSSPLSTSPLSSGDSVAALLRKVRRN